MATITGGLKVTLSAVSVKTGLGGFVRSGVKMLSNTIVRVAQYLGG